MGPLEGVVVREVVVEGRVVVTRVVELLALDIPAPERFDADAPEYPIILVGVARFLSSSLLVLPDDL